MLTGGGEEEEEDEIEMQREGCEFEGGGLKVS